MSAGTTTIAPTSLSTIDRLATSDDPIPLVSFGFVMKVTGGSDRNARIHVTIASNNEALFIPMASAVCTDRRKSGTPPKSARR